MLHLLVCMDISCTSISREKIIILYNYVLGMEIKSQALIKCNPSFCVAIYILNLFIINFNGRKWFGIKMFWH